MRKLLKKQGFIIRSNNGRRLERNRKFVDSPLEGTGFELLVRGRVKLGIGRQRQRNRTARRSRCRCASVTFDRLVPRTKGREGKDIVVLDRWAEDRTEGAVSSLAIAPGIGIMKVPARIPL